MLSVINAAQAAAAAVDTRKPGANRGTNSDPTAKFNSAPPPTIQYTADAALAMAANAVDDNSGKASSSAMVVQPGSLEKAKAVFQKQVTMTDEDKKRSEVRGGALSDQKGVLRASST